MSNRTLTAGLVAGVLLAAGGAHAQVVHPDFECAYTFEDLGSPPGVPGPLGGIVFKAGAPDTILIGGSANQAAGAIYEIGVTRDANDHVDGFVGTATLYASAPSIDGALFYGPGDVLFFSQYSQNDVGQIKPGSTAPDKIIDLSALGFTSSVGAMMLVPDGFPGAGRLKVAPFNSWRWHDATITPDGNGTFDISAPTNEIEVFGGPEGIVYVEAGASLFENPAILLSEYSAGDIAAYDMDANGDIVPASRREFITGLSGAEGGTRDFTTGDFLFSTFGGGNRVIVVRGFNPDCRANYNADCAINTQDFIDFLNDWNNQVPRADLNDDTLFNTSDVILFLNIWAAGCD